MSTDICELRNTIVLFTSMNRI